MLHELDHINGAEGTSGSRCFFERSHDGVQRKEKGTDTIRGISLPHDAVLHLGHIIPSKALGKRHGLLYGNCSIGNGWFSHSILEYSSAISHQPSTETHFAATEEQLKG